MNNVNEQQQQQQLPPLIWPMNPANAFQLIVCGNVPYTNTQNSTEKMREPAQPKTKKNNKSEKEHSASSSSKSEKEEDQEREEDKNDKVTKEGEAEEEEEEEEKMPTDQRVRGSMARFRLSYASSSQQQPPTVEIGQQVELQLELSAVISRYEKHFSSPDDKDKDAEKIEDIPEEASLLHRRVKIGPIRWEAEIPTPPSGTRFVPAPPCSRTFPFRDTHFTPTADHLGLKMRALAILQDAETDQVIMFQHQQHQQQQTRPAVIASDIFTVVPPLQMEQVMSIANNKGQIGCFAKEKVVVEVDEETLEKMLRSEEEAAMKKKMKKSDDQEKETETEKEKEAQDKLEEETNQRLREMRREFLKKRTVEGRAILIACKKFDQDEQEAEHRVGIRIQTKEREENDDDDAKEKENDKNAKMITLFEGSWRPPKTESDPVSLCSLFVGDDVTMTIHFSEMAEEKEENKGCDDNNNNTQNNKNREVQVLFKSRLDRDVAAAGMRSLM